jgi:hypothetical protein
MILEYFVPERIISFDEWDNITAHKAGLWTWTMKGLIWFRNNGFEVKNIESFDYGRFSKTGADYVLEYFGNEVGKSQIEHSDIMQEVKISKDFIREIDLDVHIPKIQEIKDLLKNGYIVLVGLNSNALDNQSGYTRHLVVVKGYTEKSLILHDPGLPPQKDLEVTNEVFYRAWAYPDERASNISALRLLK